MISYLRLEGVILCSSVVKGEGVQINCVVVSEFEVVEEVNDMVGYDLKGPPPIRKRLASRHVQA